MGTIETVLKTLQEEILMKDLLQTKPLKSLFNSLNGNDKHCVYPVAMITDQGDIVYPTDSVDSDGKETRVALKEKTEKILSEYQHPSSIQDVNSLLDELERTLSYVSCGVEGLEDVSLFEHARLQAGIQCALKQASAGELLFISMDMSGIQSFIYHMYDSKDVLKSLRARSFYLEILMENMVDELLGRFELSRANLMYVGGGHAYIMLPNHEESMTILNQYEKEVNEWFLSNFETGLFLAIGYTLCTEKDLHNEPVGSYNRIFRDVSASVSQKKRRRYSCEEIKLLNNSVIDSGRECRICHTSSRSIIKDGSDLCNICKNLINLSKPILTKQYFVICNESAGGLTIFPDMSLKVCDKLEYEALCNENLVIRSYVKNGTQKNCKSIYVGDYSAENTISELVKQAKGVKKLGVIRGDIDNLGHAFVNGFEKSNQNIFRAIAFSKSLSLFFKFNINSILEKNNRKVSIVYSGGDDVFLLGAWNDALDAMIDIERELQAFSLQALTISAGFGMFDEKYPISYIADMVGGLEDCSKGYDNKNALTLFTDDGSHTFHWNELNEKVLGEKKLQIANCLKNVDERGTAFLYNIVELVRNADEKINIARLAYMLGRLSPKDDLKDPRAHANYMAFKEFEKNLMDWVKFSNDPNDQKQFIAACELYVYENRKTEVEE